MTPAPKPSFWSRAIPLPLVAVGLAALLPLRAMDLVRHWQPLPSAVRPAYAAPTPPPRQIAEATKPVKAPPPAAEQEPEPVRGLPIEDHTPEGHMLAEVNARKADLDRKERELQTRATQVAAAERLARQQIAELARLREDIEKLVAHETGASEADLTLLVGLYSNMKPQQAAVVLGKLEARKAAAILQRLDTRSAGPIMAAMDPSAALAITEELEQRRSAFRK